MRQLKLLLTVFTLFVYSISFSQTEVNNVNKIDGIVWGFTLAKIDKAGGAKAFFEINKEKIKAYADKNKMDYWEDVDVVLLDMFETQFNIKKKGAITAKNKAIIAKNKAIIAKTKAITATYSDEMMEDLKMRDVYLNNPISKQTYSYFESNSWTYQKMNALNKTQQKEHFKKAGISITDLNEAYKSFNRIKDGIKKIKYEREQLEKEVEQLEKEREQLEKE